jgi:D-alanyl-lipoteichoic acid acyltransferase DltB (MBOAT superfamily)
MYFASLSFVLFCLLVFAVYWSIRNYRWQNAFLILANYFFYAWWDWRFCGLMLLSSLIDFVIGIALSGTEHQRKRRILLWTAIACNLAILCTFKYYGFFVENLRALVTQLGLNLHITTYNIILPIGISFYTFQSMSYSIDIYRRQLEPTRNIIDYLAFVSFFPQLAAGPIERAGRLLPQFARPRTFDPQYAADGLRLILWGMAKKILLADRLAIIVDQIYGNAGDASGALLAFATVCFAFQIYCDFSAYSEIGKGTAQLFGITLMRNFAYPYFSQSVGEFWRRWHISLSTWFRDYIYIPLGGNKVSAFRTRINLLVTFLISGFWHGAAWRFLAWGAIHGLLVTGTRREKKSASHSDPPGSHAILPRPGVLFRMATTFGIVCIGWVFFRASSMTEGVHILQTICQDVLDRAAYAELFHLIRTTSLYKHAIVLLTLFVVVEWLQRHRECPLEFPSKSHVGVRWATYTLLFWVTLYLVPPEGSQQFIYFEF